MRILYSHRIQSRDGQSVHVDELVAAFRRAGHEVLVVGPSLYDKAGFGGESRAVALLRRMLPRPLAEAAELAYNLQAYRRLRAACARFRPDLIYERYNLYYLAGALLARRTGLPFYLEVNSPIAEERSRYGGLALRGLARRLERWTWRSATRVLAVTGVLRDMIAAAGVRFGRIEVVPNGIDPARFAALPVAEDNAGWETVTLGFVGFVRNWHGLDAVIRGMAGDPRMRLAVVGDGPARPGLEELARTLGIADRVRFLGVVAHDEVAAHVAGFDIALQPRVVAYASPLKIFDYLAAGRAIIAPDQPNIREVLEDGRNAVLFDPERDGALWAAIQRLADDAALRRRLGAAARATVQARDFTWRGNAARIARWALEDSRA